jgi:hypothetical protein
LTEKSELEKLRLELALRDLDKTYDLTADLAKWVGATVFALNGAAMIALLSSPETRRLLVDGPGWLFAIGVILPVVGTIIAVRSLALMGNAMSKALWKGGNLDVSSIEELTPDLDDSAASKAVALSFSVSIICFVIGCFWGVYLISNEQRSVEKVNTIPPRNGEVAARLG